MRSWLLVTVVLNAHCGDQTTPDASTETEEVACCGGLSSFQTIAYCPHNAEQLAALAEEPVLVGNVALCELEVEEIVLTSVLQIDGHVWIAHNPALVRVAIPNLVRVFEGIVLFDDPRLETVDLGNLTHLGERYNSFLSIGESSVLHTVKLDRLEWLPRLIIHSAPALSYLDLPNFQTGSLALFGVGVTRLFAPLLSYASELSLSQTALTNLELPGLTRSDRVLLEDNDRLVSFSLPALLTPGGAFAIMRNDLLSNLQGLSSLENMTELVISDNHSLTTLAGLEGLRTIGGLSVGGLGLISLAALDGLQTVGGLSLGPIGAIPTTPVLAGLTNVGQLTIGGALGSHLNGFHALTQAGSLAFVEGLATLDAFDQLTTIESELRVEGSSLSVVALPALTNLGALTIRTNPALMDLEFPLLASVSGNVVIVENPALAQCEAEGTVATVAVGGGALIYGNNFELTCP